MKKLQMNHGPDVLIVKPGSQKLLYGGLDAFNLTAIEPPLWGAVLAGYLRARGYSVMMLDAEVQGLSYESTADRILEIGPLLVLVAVCGTNPSASTMNMTGSGHIAQCIKEKAPELKVLFHGVHPSALPERTLREENIDYVCQGEGFHTLPELIDALKAGEQYPKTQGLWYMKDGAVFQGKRPPLIEHINQLPMPAWDLLPMTKYRAHNWHCFDNLSNRQPYGVIYTSLGCPFNCSFCCINAIFGKPGIRQRGAWHVISEIGFLVENYGIRNIKIIDELFALNDSHVHSICDMIIERKYDLNIWAYARVDTVNERMLEKMKKAGINWVAYGFESGSKEVLKGVTKGYNADKLWSVINMTYGMDLNIVSNFIFGLPDDNLESMRATLDLAKEINGEWANMYATMAFPGSKLYGMALANNWPLPDSWEGYSPYSYECLPLPTNHLTGPEVLKFRDEAFNEYYSSEAYLKKIGTKFGQAAVDHINIMSSKSLKRRYNQN